MYLFFFNLRKNKANNLELLAASLALPNLPNTFDAE